MRKSRIDDSSGKPQRQSRIPAPKRSTLGKGDRRSVSEDRGGFSLKKSSLVVPQSISRSSSANRITPMRTPITRTPMFSGSSRKTPMDDKKWFQEQITRIFDYIGNIEGLDKNFVTSRNIRLMSIKDFLRIVCHLAKFWMPRVNLNNDYVDDVATMLQKLRYPYNFNKSWLKTPNAPHSLHHIVIMIAWLLNAVPGCRRPVETTTPDLKNFPTPAYADFFQESVQNAYQMWNDGDDQGAEKIRKEIINEYVAESCGVTNEETLRREIAKFTKECDEIQVEADAMVAREDSVEKLKKLVEEKHKKLATIVQAAEKKERELLTTNEVDLAKTLKKMMEVEANIRMEWERQQKQKWPEKKEQLIGKLNEAKLKHQAMVELKDKSQSAGFNAQTEKCRTMKKKLDLKNEITLVLHRISNLCPSEFPLPPNFNLNSLDAKARAALEKKLDAIQEKILRKDQQKKLDITSLKLENDAVMKEKERCTKSVEALTKTFIDLEEKRLQNFATKNRNLATLHDEINKAEQQNAMLQEQSEKIEVEIAEEEKKQEAHLETFDRQSTEIMEANRAKYEAIKSAYDAMKEDLKQFGFNLDDSHQGETSTAAPAVPETTDEQGEATED